MLMNYVYQQYLKSTPVQLKKACSSGIVITTIATLNWSEYSVQQIYK